MNPQQLRIPARINSGRVFRLFKSRRSKEWQYRFRPPHPPGTASPRRVSRSTGTTELAAARAIAARVIESFWHDRADGSSKHVPRCEFQGLPVKRGAVVTIGEVLQAYLGTASAKPQTLRNNAGALRMVVRVGLGTANPDEQSSTVLSGDLVREFEARFCAGKTGPDLARARGTVASYLRQARSVVARRHANAYALANVKLPPLAEFQTEPTRLPVRVLPVPLPAEVIERIKAAVPALRESDPGVYVAHLMFAGLGLRNIEIVHARSHWIREGAIGIIERPEECFSPKGTQGYVSIAPDLAFEILSFQHLCMDGFLVPGRNATERHDAVYRRHSQWVRAHGITGRTKTSYELRRYAGSRLLDQGASVFTVRDFLRHRDVQTTQRWYACRLAGRALPTIGLSDLR